MQIVRNGALHQVDGKTGWNQDYLALIDESSLGSLSEVLAHLGLDETNQEARRLLSPVITYRISASEEQWGWLDVLRSFDVESVEQYKVLRDIFDGKDVRLGGEAAYEMLSFFSRAACGEDLDNAIEGDVFLEDQVEGVVFVCKDGRLTLGYPRHPLGPERRLRAIRRLLEETFNLDPDPAEDRGVSTIRIR